MIDTIVLRIHNLRKNEIIVNTLFAAGRGAVTQAFTQETFDQNIVRDKGVHSLYYHDSGNFLTLNHRSSLHICSSHYELSYLVNMDKDFIEFNFSIPKYKYGTNILQFIDYFSQHKETEFVLLQNFLRDFLHSFSSQLVDRSDVEINRIDFCYNQFHTSKDDALKYLNAQKHLIAVKTKGSGTDAQIRPTSVMYITRRYSFKIYHKGSEFMKNDYKQIEKFKDGRFDLRKLVECSDRILRYEVTFRSAFFDYVFERSYVSGTELKRDSPYWYLFKVLKVDGLRVRKKNFMLKSEYDDCRKLFVAWKMDKNNADKQKWFLRYVKNDFVTFDRFLFDSLYEFFWKNVKQYQVKGLGDLTNLKALIRNVNETEEIKKQLSSINPVWKNEKKLLMWIELSKKSSLKDFVKKGMLSRRQYHYIMVCFKKMNLDHFNPVLVLTKPSLDYQEYKYYFGSYH